MKYGKSTTHLFFFLAIAALVLITLYVMLFIMLRSKNHIVSDLTNDIEYEQSRESRVASLRSLVQDISNEGQIVSTRLIAPGERVSFISKVESLGRISGAAVAIRSVVSEEAKIGNTELTNLKFNVLAEGSRSAVSRYIELIETMPYHVTIQSASLQSSDTAWSANINFTVAMQPI